MAGNYQLLTSCFPIHKILQLTEFLGRGLFVRSTFALPSLRNARYEWSLNSTRSLLSTRRPPRPLRGDGIGTVVPFFDYEDVILVSRIQTSLDCQTHLEQDLTRSDLDPILGMAIEMQKQDVVRFLLNKDADSNGWSYVQPISHLVQAAHFENLEIIMLLLNHGAYPHGCGALWQAASAGNIAAAEALIGQGADVNEIISPKICDNLHYLEDQFRLCQLQEFLEESQQGTLLHAAAMNDKADMIEFLLGRGANKAIQNEEGQTAADIVEYGFGGPPEDYDGCISEERRDSDLRHAQTIPVKRFLILGISTARNASQLMSRLQFNRGRKELKIQ